MKIFIESQFGYCPLVWMFHARIVNRKVNHLHERFLRDFYEDYNSPFEGLLRQDKSVTVHHSNIQSFTIEILKIK